MRLLPQLDIGAKLAACCAIVCGFGVLIVLWLLEQLAQMGAADALASAASTGAAAAAAAADTARLAREQFNDVRNLSMALLALWLLFTVVLSLWLASAATRPVRQAAAAARRGAAGDLSQPINTAAPGQAGLLLGSMQAMNDRLVGMIVDVRAASVAIARDAGDISTASLDLSARTRQQGAALQRTVVAVEALAATVRHGAGRAHHAGTLAGAASALAAEGAAAVAGVAATLAAATAASQNIERIAGVIDGIATQAQLLACNAAHGAAHAGEPGRSLALVDAAAGTLAQQSAAAAHDLRLLLDDARAAVTAGTVLAGEAGATLSALVASVARVASTVIDMADAGTAQAGGIEQVNKALAAMDQASRHHADLAPRAAVSAASVREHAGSLTRITGAFALGPQYAGPAAPIHLVASQPGRPAGAGVRRRATAAPLTVAAVDSATPAPSDAAKRGNRTRRAPD